MTKDLTKVLIRPHITEKATVSSENSVYVFKIDPKASKLDVEKSFIANYKVTPVKVRTVTISPKKVVVRGKRGVQSGYKKAYVYVKKGEKVEIMK